MKTLDKKGEQAIAVAFLSLLLIFSILNAHLVAYPLCRYFGGVTDFEGMVAGVRAAYVSEFSFKNVWIDLNGAYVRLTGRRVYRGVSRLPGGMLDRDGLPALDTSPLSAAIVLLARELEEEGVPLLYVQVPSKTPLDGSLGIDGIENAANQNADALCAALRAEGIDVLDLRPALAKGAEEVSRFFYRTDHHWNTDGAFCAFETVLSRISASLPQKRIDLSACARENWERSVYPRWFLGSHGKRVGRFFGGVDDLILYVPRTSPSLSMSIPHKNEVRQGSFSEVLLRTEYLDSPDYFGENPYCIYIGGDYPLSVHENAGVENGAHVLWIKDSFTLPVEAMLSCALSRLDVIDPRYFHEESVLSYATRTQPDLVVIALNPSVFSDEVYHSLTK